MQRAPRSFAFALLVRNGKQARFEGETCNFLLGEEASLGDTLLAPARVLADSASRERAATAADGRLATVARGATQHSFSKKLRFDVFDIKKNFISQKIIKMKKNQKFKQLVFH